MPTPTLSPLVTSKETAPATEEKVASPSPRTTIGSTPSHVLKRPRLDSYSSDQISQEHDEDDSHNSFMRNLTTEDYYVHEGLRYVLPYYFTYKVSVKKRWLKRKLIEVFSSEFKYKSMQYWLDEISSRRLILHQTGKKEALETRPDTVLQQGHFLYHKVHRHESPAPCHKYLSPESPETIPILYQDDHVLVVEKPTGIPIHACGTFRKNCLLSLIALHHGIYDLLVIHRLDSCTSGLVILAKNKAMAKILADQLLDKDTVKKIYLARVKGKFPAHADSEKADQGHHQQKPEEQIQHQLESATMDSMQWKLRGSDVVCEEKLFWDLKFHFAKCDSAKGKDAKTIFNLIEYDQNTDTSLVQCTPLTGRSHQIRVHLQRLGHPIANDMLYNSNKDIHGHQHQNLVEKRLCEEENVGRQPEQISEKEYRMQENEDSNESTYLTIDKLPDRIRERVKREGQALECSLCPWMIAKKDFQEHSEIWLHAACYEGPGWKYTTGLPPWAWFGRSSDAKKTICCGSKN